MSNLKSMVTDKQKKALRKLAHHLKVIVIIGQHGLGETVISEIDTALERHELLKVRINASDREQRKAMIEQIANATGSDIIQEIGHVAVFYRKAEESKLEF